ncbi:MAG: hypothetical protein WDA60_05970 [Acidimicrobiia bacterium]|jgi:hypothetical protein
MGQMLVYTNPVDGRDAEYNRWYDEVHIPEVLTVAEFTAAKRFRLADAQVFADQPFRYLAIYEYAGTADAAVNALMKASSTFEMSDAMDGTTHVVLFEER